ncbi:substrate-binding domain-containing protein [Clostridium sp. AL.422]|uniref:substrate-binding domain-containing protein n=1 Tax=Clostridium TaxID=1485 RepID=UPI00293DF52D|nr:MULTISPECIES: substrate-binding domain-containing protein [unclassified Clostridium]MDV4151853.1 substrate-binding domain-containing protein [Clostridium sp. AL.422]
MKRIFIITRYLLFIGIFFILIFRVQDILREQENYDENLKKKVVLISHVYSNPYWQDVRKGAENAAKDKNIIVEFQGPDYASVDEGLRLIKMAYASNVSGIITYVQDGSKYNSIINKVIENGIPIVTIDSDAEESKRLSYVGTDNVNAGKAGAKELLRLLGNEGDIGIILGGIEVKNQVERVQGFREYIEANSNAKITNIESSDSYLLQAELAAKKILTDNNSIEALFCTSAQDGIGAAKAVKNMNLVGKIKIVCFDALPETLDLIEEGVISATIAQNPYVMGQEAVNTIVDIIDGKNVKDIQLVDVLVINDSNIDEYK